MAADGRRPTKIEPYYGDATKTSDAGAWEQKRRLAGAMRLVIERLVPSGAPEAELRAAAEALERYAETLEAHPRLTTILHPSRHGEAALAGDVIASFDKSPLIGLANPLAPPITIGKTGPRRATGHVVFGSAYEGPPGHVHGGFVAAAFDEVLGFTQSLSGTPGMTGTLTIRYLKPTPLHAELLIDGEYLRTEGRKVFTRGRMRAGELVTAEAEAIFVSIGAEKAAQLERSRQEIERRLAGEPA